MRGHLLLQFYGSFFIKFAVKRCPWYNILWMVITTLGMKVVNNNRCRLILNSTQGRRMTFPPFQSDTHPTDAQKEVEAVRVAHRVPQLPIEQVLPGEDQQAEPHGYQQHVEHPGHVVDVQLGAHHLLLLVATDACQPHRLQLLRVAWRGIGRSVNDVCFV